MFATNQIFEISGKLEDLPAALDFAMRCAGYHKPMTRSIDRVACGYQITEKGVYCLGFLGVKGRTATYRKPGPYEGWTAYDFDYDPEIVSRIVMQWLKKQDVPTGSFDRCDGMHLDGFLLREIRNPYKKDTSRYDLRNPQRGIISIQPYRNFYHQ